MRAEIIIPRAGRTTLRVRTAMFHRRVRPERREELAWEPGLGPRSGRVEPNYRAALPPVRLGRMACLLGLQQYGDSCILASFPQPNCHDWRESARFHPAKRPKWRVWHGFWANDWNRAAPNLVSRLCGSCTPLIPKQI